jgi:hypothetical protein
MGVCNLHRKNIALAIGFDGVAFDCVRWPQQAMRDGSGCAIGDIDRQVGNIGDDAPRLDLARVVNDQGRQHRFWSTACLSFSAARRIEAGTVLLNFNVGTDGSWVPPDRTTSDAASASACRSLM